MKKYLTSFLIGIIISCILFSCKSDLEKIDINSVEAHRAYQDRVLDSDSTHQGRLANIKRLIRDYRELEKDNLGNNNLNYYLARAYNNVNSLPFRGFWLDTISNTMTNEADYINFYDSAYYFSEKALEQNKDNIRAMYILSESFYYEKARQEINPDIKVPFSFYRNETLFGKRISYIINNALRFKDIDTTKGKYLSRGISEVALYILTLELGGSNYNYDSNNQNLVNKYFILGELFDYVKGQEKVIYNFKEDDFEKKLLSSINLARNELKRLQLIKEEKKRLEEAMNNFDQRIFQAYYETRDLSREYIKFNRNGTYEWGRWELSNLPGDLSRTYFRMNTNKFEFINNTTILLKNFFYNDKNDLRMKFWVYSVLGVENPVITALRPDGSLYKDLEFWMN